MDRIYDKVVLDEGGFAVELSNRGKKLMFNPNPQNLNKQLVTCRYPSCEAKTNSIFALCRDHNDAKGRKEIRHTTDWFVRLIPPGYSRDNVLIEVMPHSQITEMMVIWMKEDKAREKIMDGFVDDVLVNIVGNVPDATTLQENIDGHKKEVTTPDGLVLMANELVDRHFPKNKYGAVKLNGGHFKGKSLSNVPIRIVAVLLILAWACEESNRGDAWFCKINNRPSKYGNAFMPSVYYFLRRYTNANNKQARMCLKG